MDKILFCPSCNDEITQIFLRNHVSEEFGNQFEIYECKNCGTKRTHPFLTNEQLNNYYIDEDIVGEGKYKEWGKKYKYIHNWIKKRIDTHGINIIEIGANSGNLLRYFKENSKCNVIGIESSVKCKEYSENVNSVPIFNGTVKEFKILQKQSADLVIMVHLFEHISEPIDFLHDISSILSEKGYVYIEIPNSNMINYELIGDISNPLCIPFHSYIYNMDSLCKLLERYNFEIISRRYWSRKEDGGSITRAYVEYFRNKIHSKFGDNLLSNLICFVIKALIRFYPNRHILGYYFSKVNQSSSIAVLCKKCAT